MKECAESYYIIFCDYTQKLIQVHTMKVHAGGYSANNIVVVYIDYISKFCRSSWGAW